MIVLTLPPASHMFRSGETLPSHALVSILLPAPGCLSLFAIELLKSCFVHHFLCPFVEIECLFSLHPTPIDCFSLQHTVVLRQIFRFSKGLHCFLTLAGVSAIFQFQTWRFTHRSFPITHIALACKSNTCVNNTGETRIPGTRLLPLWAVPVKVVSSVQPPHWPLQVATLFRASSQTRSAAALALSSLPLLSCIVNQAKALEPRV